MARFSVMKGALTLAVWDTEAQSIDFHPSAGQVKGQLVVRETDQLEFCLEAPEESSDYRIQIGDVPLADILSSVPEARGRFIGGRLFWARAPYFDSARDATTIHLQSRAEGTGEPAWTTLLEVCIWVVPSKIGEAAYVRMAGDLKQLNRSLLLDLYGKSRRTRDLRYARGGLAQHSMEEELQAIAATLDRLGHLLPGIQKRPASRMRGQSTLFQYWGGERLSPSGAQWLASRGVSPVQAPRPVLVRDIRPMESFDVPEHRLIKSFLLALERRADACARAAKRDILHLQEDQPYRDHKWGDQQSLFETNDLPKIQRLRVAERMAARNWRMASALAELPFLRGVKPDNSPVQGGVFLRSPEYIETFKLYREFLGRRTVWADGSNDSAITKMTWRLFEQWCFLWIVESFRTEGLELVDWEDTLRQHLRSRFLLDFNRGLYFEGAVSTKLRLRIRYEPWIFGRGTALANHETLCRGTQTDVPWSPDIVIECLEVAHGEPIPVYAIVLDSKYKSQLREDDWSGTAKYRQIRATGSARQVVKQLWLVAPGECDAILSQDPLVAFEANGVTCGLDESVSLAMRVALHPESGDGTLKAPNVFREFAASTLAYIRQHLT